MDQGARLKYDDFLIIMIVNITYGCHENSRLSSRSNKKAVYTQLITVITAKLKNS